MRRLTVLYLFMLLCLLMAVSSCSFFWGPDDSEQCPDCNGKGYVLVDCEACGGKGFTRLPADLQKNPKCESCAGLGVEECIYCNGEGTITCTYCHGDGKDQENIRFDCFHCQGRGYNFCDTCDGLGIRVCTSCSGLGYEVDFDADYHECPECHALRKQREDCPKCGGRGRIYFDDQAPADSTSGD